MINLILIIALLSAQNLQSNKEHIELEVTGTDLDICSRISSLNLEPNESIRSEYVQTLLGGVARLDEFQAASFEDSSIECIASLLADKDERVKVDAAVMLGVAGPRAKLALPALRQALEEAILNENPGRIGPSVSASDVFRSAIRKIESDSAKGGD